MFEQIFSCPRALARHANGPMAEERWRYLAHCVETRMSAPGLQAVASYTLAVAKVLRLADRSGELISRAEIDTAADRWTRRADRHCKEQKKHKRRGSPWRTFRNYAVRWLKFLGRLQAPPVGPQPYGDRIVQFFDYLRRERGLSSHTITQRRWIIGRFLTQIQDAGLRFDKIVIAQVDDLLTRRFRKGNFARATMVLWASVVRGFFQFAEECRWCRRGIADAIMRPQLYRYESLPTGPSWADVSRMLAAAQGDRTADIRDRALLMLLAVYGLRAIEVATLRLEDFDWEQEKLSVVHSKSLRARAYPLCRSVGDAVLRYLREARPRSERREVFLTLTRPFRPLQISGVSMVVSQRLHALGITLPHYGSHTLRHACATHLLAQGLSLKEVGDHLGHRCPDTTRIYAKVDLAGLRIVGDFDLEGLL